MSFQQSARILGKAGVPLAMDVRGVALPDLRTRQQLDELGARGYEEMQRNGSSYSYLQWQAALAAGLDETLPDLDLAGGAIARSVEETYGLLAEAQSTGQQYFARGSVDPLITQLGWQDLPVDEVRDNLSMALIDAPNHQRPAIMRALSAIENSGKTAITSMSFDMPEERMVVEANSTDDSVTQDPYTTWRHGIGGGHGLEGLAIKPSVSADPLFSGITTLNNDGGGVWERSSDWVADQYEAQAAATGGPDDE
jgi:hypothetical protein